MVYRASFSRSFSSRNAAVWAAVWDSIISSKGILNARRLSSISLQLLYPCLRDTLFLASSAVGSLLMVFQLLFRALIQLFYGRPFRGCSLQETSTGRQYLAKDSSVDLRVLLRQCMRNA